MKLIAITIFFITIVGCSKEPNFQNNFLFSEVTPSKVKLVQKELLTIPIDNETSYWVMPYHFGYTHSMNLLYLWNSNNQSLYFFDLDEKQQVLKVPIPLRTDLEINQINMIKPIGLDSIFIFDAASSKAPKLHIFNANSREISSFNLLNGNSNSYVDYSRPMFHVDSNSGNVFMRLAISWNEMTNEKVFCILRYNFKTKKEDFFIEFPEDYRIDHIKSGPGISFNFDQEGNILFSLPFEKEFLVIDSSTFKTKKTIPKNSPLMQPYKPIGDNLRPVEERWLRQTLSRWVDIVYDPYRDLSYHIGIIGQKLPDPLPDDIFTNVPYRKSVNEDSVYFTMMIFDGKHQPLGEVNQPFPKGILYPITTPYGILEIKHSRSPGESQDELMFYVYDIERIEEHL